MNKNLPFSLYADTQDLGMDEPNILIANFKYEEHAKTCGRYLYGKSFIVEPNKNNN